MLWLIVKVDYKSNSIYNIKKSMNKNLWKFNCISVDRYLKLWPANLSAVNQNAQNKQVYKFYNEYFKEYFWPDSK